MAETTPIALGHGVQVRGSVLEFSRSREECPPEDRIERAKILLEVLRAEGDGLTFGGQIKNGIDGRASITRYYRVIEMARVIVEACPEAAPLVHAFLESISVPEDLLDLLKLAITGEDDRAPPERAARSMALGDVARWDHPEGSQGLWASWQAGDPDVHRVNDGTIDRAFSGWGWANDFSGFFNFGDEEFKAGVFRFFARAKELGKRVELHPRQLPGFLRQIPATAEAASAVLRCCAAFGIDTEPLILGGTRLTAWPKPPAPRLREWLRAPVVPRPVTIRGGRPLGNVQTWENDSSYNKIWARMCLGDPETGLITDETIRKWFDVWSANYELMGLVSSGTPASRVIFANIWARAKELGMGVRVRWERMVDYAQHMPPSREAAHALARLGRAFGHDVDQLEISGYPIADLLRLRPNSRGSRAIPPPGKVAAQSRLTLPEVGPLGSIRYGEKEIEQRIVSKDPALFYLDDASLDRLLAWGSIQKLAAVSDDHDWLRGVLRVANRFADRSVGDRVEMGLMIRSIPIQAFEDERVAEAVVETAYRVGVNFDTQLLSNGAGFKDHPTLAPWISNMERILMGTAAAIVPRRGDSSRAKGREAAREQALVDDLAMVDPNSSAHAADREGAVLRILSIPEGEEAIAQELSEILPAILWAREDGRLGRVELRTLPQNHRDEILKEAFSTWDHPGAIAVLAGLLFHVDARDLERVLAEKGQIPSEARRLSRIGAELGELGEHDLRYVLGDVLGGESKDPDFSTLALRLEMCAENVSRRALRDHFDNVDPEIFVHIVLDRAALLPFGCREASVLLNFLRNRILAEELDLDLVRAAIDPAFSRRLEDSAIEAISSLMATPKARGSVAGILRSVQMFLAPERLIRSTLDEVYREDLRHVAPLAEVDRELGGVAGRAWQVRARSISLDPAEGERDVADVEGVLLERWENVVIDPATPVDDPRLITETGRRNLRTLATRWLSSPRMELVGDGRREMESAARRIAYAIGAPYSELWVSSDTEPATLRATLGRAEEVGGVLYLGSDGSWPPGLTAMLAGLDHARGLKVVAQSSDATSHLESCVRVAMRPLVAGDFESLLEGALGEPTSAPARVRALANIHIALARAAQKGELGSEPPAFDLASLSKVARRMDRFSAGELTYASLLRREIDEVYTRGLPDDARDAALDIVDGVLSSLGAAAETYRGLSLEIGDEVAIGDVTITPRGPSTDADPTVSETPANAVDDPAHLAPRLAQGFYLLAKALECGEPVALVGDDVPILSRLYASLSGQLHHEHLLTEHTDLAELLSEDSQGVFTVLDLERATHEVASGLALAARQGRIQVVASGVPSMAFLGAEWTGVRLPEQSKLEAATEWAAHEQVPVAIAAAVVALDDELSRNLGAEVERSEFDQRMTVAEAISLIGRLARGMSPGAAYLAAVEAIYGTEDLDETERMLETARGFAEG